MPVFDEVVLSTALMSHIEEFDDVSGDHSIVDDHMITSIKEVSFIIISHASGVVTCQAGVVLGNLESFLHPKGYTVPLDLGAKGR